MSFAPTNKRKVLQFCHCHYPPFDDIAIQYSFFFKNSEYDLITVFLTGEKNNLLASQINGEVIFLENTSKSVRGLKIKQIKQLKKLHQKHDFFFVVTHRHKPFYIATYLKNIHIIAVFHGLVEFVRWTHRFHAYNNRKKITLLGVSNFIRDYLRSKLPKFDVKSILTLHNHLSLEKINRPIKSKINARDILHLPQNAYVFGNVGRLHSDKDQTTLIKAFAKHYKNNSNSHLVIMGTGTLDLELKQLSKSLNILNHVHFTGFIPEGSNLFKAFDCFVLSSNQEPFGMVLLESMLAENTIIVADTGGPPEVVGDTAVIFKTGDVDDLCSKMDVVLTYSENIINNKAKAMKLRIEELFSYKAAHKNFWSLPCILNIKNN